ncbi:MAG: hypothetical protein IPJ85_07010 [Flavobacteriales bacterium]|nr:hypothetical protein [Flavobacteriales bacterium]
MIINSDERQWTWMDEGLNTFVQYLTEQEWDKDYPSWRGKPRNIVDYMKGDPNAAPDKVKARIEPIMTNSESITQFGNNAYGKPCTALNILRETVMGRELFDRLQDLLRSLEVQAANASGFLPHDGRCVWRRSRLVLARLVLHHRSRGPQYREPALQAPEPARSRARGEGEPR